MKTTYFIHLTTGGPAPFLKLHAYLQCKLIESFATPTSSWDLSYTVAFRPMKSTRVVEQKGTVQYNRFKRYTWQQQEKQTTSELWSDVRQSCTVRSIGQEGTKANASSKRKENLVT
jgi:hypothetical protein